MAAPNSPQLQSHRTTNMRESTPPLQGRHKSERLPNLEHTRSRVLCKDLFPDWSKIKSLTPQSACGITRHDDRQISQIGLAQSNCAATHPRLAAGSRGLLGSQGRQGRCGGRGRIGWSALCGLRAWRDSLLTGGCPMSPEARKYLASIGSKGGKATGASKRRGYADYYK